MCNLLQRISFMTIIQTHVCGIKSSKNKINLLVLQSLFESLNHTHTFIRHSMTLRLSYCGRYSCISCCVGSHNFVCQGVTDLKFLYREYTKGATKNFLLLRKLLFLFGNIQYKITRLIFNEKTCIRNISHKVVSDKIRSPFTGVLDTRVGTLIVTTIYLQLIQNRYMFRTFTVLQCSHQHCVQPVASDVEVVGYLQQRMLC